MVSNVVPTHTTLRKRPCIEGFIVHGRFIRDDLAFLVEAIQAIALLTSKLTGISRCGYYWRVTEKARYCAELAE